MHNKLCNVKNMQASISCNIFVPLDTVLLIVPVLG